MNTNPPYNAQVVTLGGGELKFNPIGSLVRLAVGNDRFVICELELQTSPFFTFQLKVTQIITKGPKYIFKTLCPLSTMIIPSEGSVTDEPLDVFLSRSQLPNEPSMLIDQRYALIDNRAE